MIYLVQQQKHYLIVLFLPVFLMLGTISCGQEELSFESDIEIKNKSSVTSYLETWAPLVEIPPDRDLENLAIEYGFGPNENFLFVKSNDQSKNVGMVELFTVANLSLTESYEVEGELLIVADNAYWYADINSEKDWDLYSIAAAKWEKIHSDYFATFEAPKLTILNTALDGAAGYFSDVDSYPKWVHSNSNERPMVYIDPSRNKPGSDKYMSVLIHEYQHLVNNEADQGEEAWVDEGLAELAVKNTGYETPLERYFLVDPDTQLNYWPDDPRKTLAHYGAASLFFEFVSGRLGGSRSLRSLVEEPLDGILGVENWLEKNGTHFHHEFGEWILANYLGSETGQYSYPTRTLKLRSGLDDLKLGENTYQVSQYGARYFKIDASGRDIDIWFNGNDFVNRFKTLCHTKCWWSNKGDSIDSSLTLSLDFMGKKASSLYFDLWHDIEEGWDYGYLSVSMDEGNTWRTLNAPGTTSDNPVGSNYGYGYSGQSAWTSHVVNLDDYADKKILGRFQYVTDAAVHLDGMLIKGAKLSEISRTSSSEDIKWFPSGFVLVDDSLEQKFLVRIIKQMKSGQYAVDEIMLDDFNEALYSIRDDENLDSVTVVVSGITGLTQQPAVFNLEVSEIFDK